MLMKTNKKIILVGCGNIGSRHLQAIVKLKNKVTSTRLIFQIKLI